MELMLSQKIPRSDLKHAQQICNLWATVQTNKGYGRGRRPEPRCGEDCIETMHVQQARVAATNELHDNNAYTRPYEGIE